MHIAGPRANVWGLMEADVTTKCWLMKTEPDVYGWDDLVAEPDATDHWDGIRNYQARNLMRDEMSVGDRVLFYHSRCKPPHVVGVAEIARAAYPDHTCWDPDAKYYDPKSTREAPRWVMVDVRAVRELERPVSLAELKANPALAGMMVTRRGARLSVQPVEPAHFDEVLAMARRAPAEGT